MANSLISMRPVVVCLSTKTKEAVLNVFSKQRCMFLLVYILMQNSLKQMFLSITFKLRKILS